MMNMNGMALLANGMSFGEALAQAGIVALQGMFTIFAVLAVLWGAIEVMHYLVHRKEKQSNGKQEQAEPVRSAEVAEPTPAPAVAEDDGVLVAAITAAISAAMAEEGYTGGFRVVSFKRAKDRSTHR